MERKSSKHAKSKKVSAAQKPNQHKISVGYLFMIPTCVLVFFPSFFRGLFFERELRIVHIATFILILIWTLINYKDKNLPIVRYKYEYFLSAAVAMYFLTVPFAAGRRMALLEALKYVNYLAVYILVRDHIQKDNNAARVYMNTILASVFVMCVLGLMNYIGLAETLGALTSGRISSTLQYPNTLAAVVGAAVFLGLYLAAVSENQWISIAYTAALNILFTTFILTFSRTMYIMFPILLLAFLVAVPSKLRGGLSVALIGSALPSLAAAVLLIRRSGTSGTISVMILLASVLLTTVLLYLTRRFKPVFALTRLARYIVAGLLLVAVALGAVAMNTTVPLELSHQNIDDGTIGRGKVVYSVEGHGDYLLRLDATAHQGEENPWIGRVVINSVNKAYRTNTVKIHYIGEEVDGSIEIPFSTKPGTYYITVGFYNHYNGTSFIIRNAEIVDPATGKSLENLRLSYRYLPDNLVTRIESINLKERSFQARIAFFRDAFSIIKDRFFIGLGGGAWQASYMKHRSYEYWTTQTHSYPMQVWMEVGTVGFLIVLGFVYLYAMNLIKVHKNIASERDRLQIVATAFFVLQILLHSLVDFDLSLGAVSILLWASLALASVHFTDRDGAAKRVSTYIKPVYATALIVCLCIVGSMAAAEYHNRLATRAFADKDYASAEESAGMAVKLDPFNPVYRLDLANAINSSDMDGADKYKLVKEQLDAAIKHSPFDAKLYGQMALLEYYYGRFDEALAALDKATSYNPAMPEPYINKMDFMYNMAKYHHGQGDREQAAELLGTLKRVEQTMIDKNKEVMIPIDVDPMMLSYYYKANYVLDNIENEDAFGEAEDIIKYEDFSFDTDEDRLPDLWQIPYQDDKIIDGRIKEVGGAEAFVLVTDSPSFYVQRMNMELQPSSRYLIVIEGYSKSLRGKMMVLVGSMSGTGQQFKEGYFVFNEEKGTYQAEFETTDDIKAGDQYLRLYFTDIEDEVILKRVTIKEID